MRKFVFLATAMTVLWADNRANCQDINSFYMDQIAQNYGPGSLFFVSKCFFDNETFMIVLPLGTSIGKYGEFSSSGIEENGAQVTFSDEKIYVGELMIGGIATKKIQQRVADALIRNPFYLISFSKIRLFLIDKAETKCRV